MAPCTCLDAPHFFVADPKMLELSQMMGNWCENGVVLDSGSVVEVRQKERGLRGSWFSAVVVKVRPGRRVVQYHELLTEDGSSRLMESIPLPWNSCSARIHHPESSLRKERGFIRPQPPAFLVSSLQDWRRGLCVDAFYEDAWWEGILMEDVTAEDQKVNIFFPDEGDRQEFMLKSLRVSQDWDADTGSWSSRGMWTEFILREVDMNQMTEEHHVKGDSFNNATLEDWRKIDRQRKVKKFKDENNYQDFNLTDHARLSSISSISDAEVDKIKDKNNNSKGYGTSGSLDTSHVFFIDRAGAKKQLEDAGWKIICRYRSDNIRKDFFYVDPNGIRYNSLAKACKAGKIEMPNIYETKDSQNVHGLKASNVASKLIASAKKRWLSGAGHDKQHKSLVKSKHERPDYFKLLKPKPEGSISKKRKLNGVSGSKKGKKSKKASPDSKQSGQGRAGCRLEVSAPGKAASQGKRTILSWLIDMHVISEDEVVCYKHKKGHVLMGGIVRREGVLCDCCKTVVSLSEFEAHAGSKLHRPSANIFLKDGRSLSECQMAALNNQDALASGTNANAKRAKADKSDDTCGICGDIGELLCCDNCPSTFHLRCLKMKVLPEGEWFCPSCRCANCGGRPLGEDQDLFCCDQCERKFHAVCLHSIPEVDEGSWFCSEPCKSIYGSLRSLVGSTNLLTEGFSWTLLRSTEEDQTASSDINLENMTEQRSKLAVALNVMQECFCPMIDPLTNIDIIANIVFNRWAEVNRLNYRGFYTVLLERDDEIISVATIRVHGNRLAEMPLIATRFQYRRQGMCRRLVNAIDEMLCHLGVENLVLPAILELLETWTHGFNFQLMTPLEKLGLNQLNIVPFPGVLTLQRRLAPFKFKYRGGVCRASCTLDPSVRVDACVLMLQPGCRILRKKTKAREKRFFLNSTPWKSPLGFFEEEISNASESSCLSGDQSSHKLQPEQPNSKSEEAHSEASEMHQGKPVMVYRRRNITKKPLAGNDFRGSNSCQVFKTRKHSLSCNFSTDLTTLSAASLFRKFKSASNASRRMLLLEQLHMVDDGEQTFKFPPWSECLVDPPDDCLLDNEAPSCEDSSMPDVWKYALPDHEPRARSQEKDCDTPEWYDWRILASTVPEKSVAASMASAKSSKLDKDNFLHDHLTLQDNTLRHGNLCSASAEISARDAFFSDSLSRKKEIRV